MEIKRDYFFEFAGMPKSGKTTIADIVVHYLKRTGVPVSEYHGGGRYAPIDKSRIAELNIYLASKAVEYLLVQHCRERTKPKVHVMDRGICDRLIFTNALKELHYIESSECASLCNMLQNPRLVSLVDAVFSFVTAPAISLARESRKKLIDAPGRVMNQEFLGTLGAITKSRPRFEASFRHVHLIDTEERDGDIEGTARLVLDLVLQELEHG